MSGPIPQPNHGRRMVAAGGAGAAAALIIAISGPLIEASEGYRPVPYLDPVKIWTDCWGNTHDVDPSHVNSLAECRAKLSKEQRQVIIAEGRCTKVAVPVESFAAFTSFSFNLGAGTYCMNIAPRVNRGDLAGACQALSLYTLAKKPLAHPCPPNSVTVRAKSGKLYCRLPGSIIRRAKERAICEGGLS